MLAPQSNSKNKQKNVKPSNQISKKRKENIQKVNKKIIMIKPNKLPLLIYLSMISAKLRLRDTRWKANIRNRRIIRRRKKISMGLKNISIIKGKRIKSKSKIRSLIKRAKKLKPKTISINSFKSLNLLVEKIIRKSQKKMRKRKFKKNI